MNRNRLTNRSQICLVLLLGLCMGFFFRPLGENDVMELPLPEMTIELSPTISQTSLVVNTPTSQPTLLPSCTPTPAPFRTIEGVWMMKLELSELHAPEVLDMVYLPKGRLVAAMPGNGIIEMLDGQENVLYQQSFEILFFSGEPLQKVDTIEMLLMLPAVENAELIKISVPQGEVSYEIPER